MLNLNKYHSTSKVKSLTETSDEPPAYDVWYEHQAPQTEHRTYGTCPKQKVLSIKVTQLPPEEMFSFIPNLNQGICFLYLCY